MEAIERFLPLCSRKLLPDHCCYMILGNAIVHEPQYHDCSFACRMQSNDLFRCARSITIKFYRLSLCFYIFLLNSFWFSLNSIDFQLIFIDFYWIPIDFHWILLIFNWFSLIYIEFLFIFIEFYWFSINFHWILLDSYWFSLNSIDFQLIFIDLYWIPIDFHWCVLNSYWFLLKFYWFFNDSYTMHKILWYYKANVLFFNETTPKRHADDTPKMLTFSSKSLRLWNFRTP